MGGTARNLPGYCPCAHRAPSPHSEYQRGGMLRTATSDACAASRRPSAGYICVPAESGAGAGHLKYTRKLRPRARGIPVSPRRRRGACGSIQPARLWAMPRRPPRTRPPGIPSKCSYGITRQHCDDRTSSRVPEWTRIETQIEQRCETRAVSRFERSRQKTNTLSCVNTAMIVLQRECPNGLESRLESSKGVTPGQ